MKRDEFLELLRRTPRDWHLSAGKIRRGTSADPDCPLSAVACTAMPGKSPSDASSDSTIVALPVAPEFANAILAAADNMEQADPVLRIDLLEACGLLIRRKGSTIKLAADPSGL